MSDEPSIKECGCLKCGGQKQVFGCRWCEDCYYPGIDEDWNEFRALIEGGYSRAKAAVMSGWVGAEEI